MTPLQQLARSLRYSSADTACVVALGDGQFALFLPGGSFEHAIGTWEEIGAAFASRPQYVPTAAPIARFANLEFNI